MVNRKVIKSNDLLEVDGARLHNPCHCGNTIFRPSLLLQYKTCSVVRCTQCGQLRTAPEPTAESLKHIYSQEAAKYALTSLDDPQRKMCWNEFSNGILSEVERFLPRKGRLLDIGCNFGDLLFAARKSGWEAEGLEINVENVRYLREQGFTMYSEFIEQVDIPDNQFDLIVINQVLEHVPRPNEFLQGIRRILKPEGLLFVGVPCFWSPIPLFLKREAWYALLPEEHIWQFSVASLKHLLNRHQLRIVSVGRGCSGFWGNLSPSPKDIVRWTLYKTVKLMRQGDFINIIAANNK